jgi:DNA-binding transcriptional MerR regulator
VIAGVNAGVATTANAAARRFTAPQAARLTGASRPQLDAWQRAGLTTAGSDYGFLDLVVVRLVMHLLDAGISLDRVQPAVRYLRHSQEEFGHLRLVTDGDTVTRCTSDADLLAAIRGCPLAVVVSVAPLAQAAAAAVDALDAERQGFVATLQAG